MGLTSEAGARQGQALQATRRRPGRRPRGRVRLALMALTLLSVTCVVWTPARMASATMMVAANEARSLGTVSSPKATAPTKVAVSASRGRVWTANGAKATSVVTATFTTAGKPVPGVRVTWRASTGSLSAATGTTGTNGEAHVTLTQPTDITPSESAVVTALDTDASTVRSSTLITFLPNRISFLPLAGHAGPWEWYASCAFVPSEKIPPSAGRGCRSSDPTFGTLVLNGDLWNLGGNGRGNVTMQINPSGQLATSEGFVSAPRLSRSTWVLGDPNVSYGVEPQAAADPPKRSPSLPLPMALPSLPDDVVATATYDLTDTASVTYDFSYDLWLEPHRAVTAPTTGTIELMIWTADGNDALPSGHEGTVSMDYALNGVGQTGRWGLYIENGNKAVATQTTVYLVLQNSADDAKVSVDFNSAFQVMEAALRKFDPSHWSSFSGYYLDSIPLGSEFGQRAGRAETGPSHWALDDYYLGLGTKLP